MNQMLVRGLPSAGGKMVVVCDTWVDVQNASDSMFREHGLTKIELEIVQRFATMKFEELSVTQQKVLKWISREPNHCEVQVAGKSHAHLCSAARSLVRKNLARTFHTGHYAATEAGRAVVQDWAKRTGTILKPLY